MKDNDRVIPVPKIAPFKDPVSSHYAALPNSDIQALKKLKEQLIETGVIDREVAERKVQSIEELNVIVAEAVALAKHEKELNPDFYDADLEEYLEEKEKTNIEWDNPVVKDYETEDKRGESRIIPNKVAKVRLPDGTIIDAELLE